MPKKSGGIVSVTEAAGLLEMDRRILGGWIRSGRCPFGIYIKEEGSQRGGYYINRTRLERYIIGVDMNPICQGKVLFPEVHYEKK